MTLIKSISGIRGIIYDNDSKGLSTNEITHCIKQFVMWVKNNNLSNKKSIALGRDGRLSGNSICNLIKDLLISYGLNVVDLGLTTTPSVQLAIVSEKCIAGIMVSASHNPINWNGLKFLNNNGEFLSKNQAEEVFNSSTDLKVEFDNNASIVSINYMHKHIQSILKLVDVDVNRIVAKSFKVVVDGINSSGGVFVPYLLDKLGVEVIKLNCIPNGKFSHPPEPLPNNLSQLAQVVKDTRANFGIAVDPDVDRLVLVCEDGSFFGEENTIVIIAKHILSNYPGSSVVSNLSTTQAVKDIAVEFNATHFESAVGEANVVDLMKKKKSIIGGEGSGGIIFSTSHYGRDALVGIALFLSYISKVNLSVKQIKSLLPTYHMIKHKILLDKNKSFDFHNFIDYKVQFCQNNNLNYGLIDGIKIYYACGSWSHIRMSNTEPLIRLIIESKTKERAFEIKSTIINEINMLNT